MTTSRKSMKSPKLWMTMKQAGLYQINRLSQSSSEPWVSRGTEVNSIITGTLGVKLRGKDMGAPLHPPGKKWRCIVYMFLLYRIVAIIFIIMIDYYDRLIIGTIILKFINFNNHYVWTWGCFPCATSFLVASCSKLVSTSSGGSWIYLITDPRTKQFRTGSYI